MTEKLKKNKLLLVSFFLVIFGFIYYLPTIQIPFYFDDIPTIVNNPSVYDLKNFFEYLSDETLYTRGGMPTTRGIVTFTYALNYFLHGLDASWFRLYNMVIHFLCALIVLFTAKFFLKDKNILWSIFAMAVFIFTSGTLQPVIYINSRSESIAVLFMTLSFLFYIISVSEKNNFFKFFIFSFLSYIIFYFSSFVKETFIIIVPIIIIYGFLFRKITYPTYLISVAPFLFITLLRSSYFRAIFHEDFLLKFFKVFFVALVILGLLFLFFYKFFNKRFCAFIKKFRKEQYRIFFKEYFIYIVMLSCVIISILYISKNYNTLADKRSMVDNILSQISLFPMNLLKIIFPYRLSIIHDPNEIYFNIFNFIFGLLVFLFYLIILIITYFKNKKVFFLICSIFISIVAYFFVTLILLFNENRLYLPAFFMSILVVFCFSEFYERTNYFKLKKLLLSLFVAVFLFNIFLTRPYLRLLKSDADYFEYASKLYPESVIINLKKTCIKYSTLKLFEEAFEDILLFSYVWGRRRYDYKNKFNYHFSKNLAGMMITLALQVKNFEIAWENIQYLEIFHPYYDNTKIYKAEYLLSTGKTKEAEKLFSELISKGEGKFLVYLRYAEILKEMNRIDDANNTYVYLINNYQSEPEVFLRYGIFLSEIGKSSDAADNFRVAHNLYTRLGEKSMSGKIETLLDFY